ncbi:rhomboid-like protein [Streptacidiphilus jiangxiensis]|uniref:Rhomboid family protein n=1 Tax=Streptacidiphilus jiangxiensis TaxID=235985 RepID=A0A1H7WVE3_STRJI|nr:rhomboid-like protein [Streptacidiphilus jiangxiensis]SEM24867.1 hypothetical protein SAMN05414137_121141 [Streptacidiphilus jiangxiensis]
MIQPEAPGDRTRPRSRTRPGPVEQRPHAGMSVRQRAWARVGASPATTAYLLVLVGVHLVLDHVLTARAAASAEQYLSTNLDNLEDHPLLALLGSGLVVDSPLGHPFTLAFGGTLITLVAGITVVLAALERRYGTARACGVLAAGHIGATLLVAPVIALAIAHGWYPASLRAAHDVGISYGAEAVLACATFTLVRGRAARVLWAVAVLAWPLAGVAWTMRLPDFTTIGHLTAAAIGFALGLLMSSTLPRGRGARCAPRVRP